MVIVVHFNSLQNKQRNNENFIGLFVFKICVDQWNSYYFFVYFDDCGAFSTWNNLYELEANWFDLFFSILSTIIKNNKWPLSGVTIIGKGV